MEGFHVEIEQGIFWLTMGIIAILGSSLVYRDYYQRRTRTEFRNRLLDRLEKGEMTPEEVLAQEYIPREAIELMRNRGWLVLRRETEVFPSEPPVD